MRSFFAVSALLLIGVASCTGTAPATPSAAGEADGWSEAAFDSSPPPVPPESPAGAYGFSRYVFVPMGDRIETILVEGPRGQQTRCQREDLPCSYMDLKTLYESGAEIPAQLNMSRDELGTLVSQLDTLAQTLARYTSIDIACAEGYQASSEQNSNMGIHMNNHAYMDGVFDPAKPEILLFAMPGGEKLNKEELGSCEDGKWTGDKRQQIVGAAFMLPTEAAGEDHPEAFAGPLDNWHVHYHNCPGLEEDAILPREACEARGGRYVEKAGWMIHAYAEPDFDNQQGVFAMWNPTIWPLGGRGFTGRMRERQQRAPASSRTEGAAHSSIVNFAFETVRAAVGDQVTFTNADRVPHTVTAGHAGNRKGTFDSGTIDTGQGFTTSFEEPGEYEFFCTLHPWMMGRVIVE